MIVHLVFPFPWIFKEEDLFVCLFICMYMGAFTACVLVCHGCAVLTEVRNWSHRQLWAARCVRGTKPGTSGRVVCVVHCPRPLFSSLIFLIIKGIIYGLLLFSLNVFLLISFSKNFFTNFYNFCSILDWKRKTIW